MATSAMEQPDDFARLVWTRLEFDQLMEQLGQIRRSIHSVRNYLANPGKNDRLGNAHMSMLMKKYRSTLLRLTYARREALVVLSDMSCLENSFAAWFIPSST